MCKFEIWLERYTQNYRDLIDKLTNNLQTGPGFYKGFSEVNIEMWINPYDKDLWKEFLLCRPYHSLLTGEPAWKAQMSSLG